ncbi:retrovirus-related Pol polyprotein from transposon 297 [Trichonephila clavipes]|nr:retrovirus-related Pol polyprotein from transposon 297 [Trichonephila clavipes]
MRLCIDYRNLNAQIVPDSYPLLRMDDLLNEAKPTPYMSTNDLRSGYHQVKVVAEGQDKAVFTCPFGIYKFTRMPFELRNAPATFQRLIDKFRSGLNNVLALSYLDDIIILSPNFQKHFSELELVFKTPPVLKPADGTKPFVNRTDASSVALETVLLQGERDEKHPIEHASRLLSSSERNYSPKKEKLLQLPVRWALQIRSYNLIIDYIPGRSHFIADLLSPPTSERMKTDRDILAVFVDFPTHSPKDVRQEQLKDE